MANETTVLIAETDDAGTVCCVCVKSDGTRHVRPFNPGKDKSVLKQNTEFADASSPDIEAWLTKAIHQHEQTT